MRLNTFYIKEPIWNGRKVGLAAAELADLNRIIIEHKKTDGSLLYPSPFYITDVQAKTFPMESAKKNAAVMLHIIPIASLTKLSEEENETVGRLLLFSGEEIDITGAQYKRIIESLSDSNDQYIEVGLRTVKKTNISLAENDEEANPGHIDRSPEALAKRQERHRKMLEKKTKEVL